ncbi:MAG: hypothetical protein KDB94_06265 [Acidobacteria bacterium]|nr:hypothetical protein [Acidobacteriota bacterium]
MKLRLVAVPTLILLFAPAAVAATAWSNFHDSFDALPVGQTIGVADPANWREFLSTPGLTLASAPGGGLALSDSPAAEPGTQSRSDRTVGLLDAGTVYEFGFRARASTTNPGSDAYFFVKRDLINGYTFSLGIANGQIQFGGDATCGISGSGTQLTAPALPDTWYQFVVHYEVREGLADDEITVYYRAEGDPQLTELGTLCSYTDDLHLDGAVDNVALGFVRPANTALDGNFLDDFYGRAILPTQAIPALDAAGVVALALALAAAAALAIRRRRPA